LGLRKSLILKALIPSFFLLGLVIFMANPSKASVGIISEGTPPVSDARYEVGYLIGDVREEIKKWPLSVEFSQDVDDQNEWLFGVHLMLFSEAGEILFDDIIDAPIFVADIPPGTYRLFGAHDGVGRSETFEIIAGTTVNITMHWA